MHYHPVGMNAHETPVSSFKYPNLREDQPSSLQRAVWLGFAEQGRFLLQLGQQRIAQRYIQAENALDYQIIDSSPYLLQVQFGHHQPIVEYPVLAESD
jgi:hypothetical protein